MSNMHMQQLTSIIKNNTSRVCLVMFQTKHMGMLWVHGVQ